MSRKYSTESSLELLLDTITNTFGSVLFLTMLVTLLLRNAGHNISSGQATVVPLTAGEQAMIQSRLVALTTEVAQLQQEAPAFQREDASLATLHAALRETAEATVATLCRDAEMAVQIATIQRRITDINTEATKIITELAAAHSRATEAEKRRELAEAQAAKLVKTAIEIDRPVDPAKIVQVAHMPELVPSDKPQFSIYLRYGRLYVMHKWSNEGKRLGPNPDQFVITRSATGLQKAKAIPQAGIIADGNTIERELRSILERFPPAAWGVTVVVHEDSFAQFQAVKSALVTLGYKYYPMSTGPDYPVQDSGGQGREQ